MSSESLTRRRPKGSRAGGFHVKTGCITCKIRHLKCDEEKPACLKCRNTGRTCDGYQAKSKSRISSEAVTVSTASERTSRNLVHAGYLSILPDRILVTFGTPQERQCFEYFRLETGKELSNAMTLEPTHHFILQASHADDAIRSAVIAIGSMGQRLRVNNVLTFDDEEANAHQEFARVYYCKALKSLQKQMRDDPTRIINLAIMSCFLFTIFEFLQGNDTGALVHLRSGLKILGRENALRKMTIGQDCLRQEITRIFCIMDKAATRWLGVKNLQTEAVLPLDIIPPAPASLNHFLNLDEAAVSLNYQINRMYHFRQWVNLFSASPDNPPNAYARYHDMMVELERWPEAMNTLLKSMGEEIIAGDNLHRVSVMQMNYQTTIIQNTLSLEWPNEPNVQDRFASEYVQILSMANSIITGMNDVTKEKIERVVQANNRGQNAEPLFSLFAGIIHPLYIVAINCRDLNLCNEAVQLLSRTPWREGAFDSAAMARIAAKRIEQLRTNGYYKNTPSPEFDARLDISMQSSYDQATMATPSPATTPCVNEDEKQFYQHSMSLDSGCGSNINSRSFYDGVADGDHLSRVEMPQMPRWIAPQHTA